jgi:CubicO group peptidase (beta-lactamase class C family)
MSSIRRPFALLLAAALAAPLNACGGKAPTGSTPPIATVTLTAAATMLAPGQSTQLVASAATADGQAVSAAAFSWLSEAPAVATVDASGRVTAVSTGTAVIAATAGTVRGAVTITVQPAPAGHVASLSSIVDSVRLAWKMPAMGAAIVTLEDGVIAIGAAGLRRVTGGASVTTNDLWHLGSNTKGITSMLAAVAVSQNRIQWTTTIPQVFPELANIRPEYRDVTLRDLLSHQSGLPGSITPAVFGGWKDLPVAAQRDSTVAWAVRQPPAGPRGRFAYSGLGYVLADAMLARVFGTSFVAAMTAQVFAPLGMTDAGFGPQAAVGSTTQPIGHYGTDGSWQVREGHDIPPVFASAGGAHMSLASWARLVREVLRVEAGTPTLASAAVAREMTSEQVTTGPETSYGLGWGIKTRVWANGKLIHHDGSNGANYSIAVLAPRRNVAILVTTNAQEANGRSPQALNDLISRLIAYYDAAK